MPADSRFGRRDLLVYNSDYKLLICRECQYAVQKSALESHLLRHKIYRDDRKRLLSSIAKLDLLEPEAVPLPSPGSAPVEGLPVLSGYRCAATGCNHLTVTSKRMRHHWNVVHGLSGPDALSASSWSSSSSSFARPVKLQTFFRGTKVKYFEVTSSSVTRLASADDDSDDRHFANEDTELNNSHEGDEEGEESRNDSAATPLPQDHALAEEPLRTSVGATSPVDFNLETLTYFHHFLTVTSLTLPGTEGPQSAKHYWQTYVVHRALQRRWLMCGLLAISALHLVILTGDNHDLTTQPVHRERVAQFSPEFFAGLEQAARHNLQPEEALRAEERESVKIGEQIRCILCRARWASFDDSTVNLYDEIGAQPDFLAVVSTIRGIATGPSPMLLYSEGSLQGDGGTGNQKELCSSRTLQNQSLHNGKNSCTDSLGPKMMIPSVLLDRLRALPFSIAEGLGRPESTQDALATISAINILIESCEIGFASNELGAVWQGATSWLANLPDHFNQLLFLHHPAAIVVLAHWAVILLGRAAHVGCWFLKGSAKSMVLQIIKELSTNDQRILVGLLESLLRLLQAAM